MKKSEIEITEALKDLTVATEHADAKMREMAKAMDRMALGVEEWDPNRLRLTTDVNLIKKVEIDHGRQKIQSVPSQ